MQTVINMVEKDDKGGTDTKAMKTKACKKITCQVPGWAPRLQTWKGDNNRGSVNGKENTI